MMSQPFLLCLRLCPRFGCTCWQHDSTRLHAQTVCSSDSKLLIISSWSHSEYSRPHNEGRIMLWQQALALVQVAIVSSVE